MSIKRFFAAIVVVSVMLLFVSMYIAYQNQKELLLEKLEYESKLNAVTAKSVLIGQADYEAHRFTDAKAEYLKAMLIAQNYFAANGKNGSIVELKNILIQNFPSKEYDISLVNKDLVVYKSSYTPDVGLNFNNLSSARMALQNAYRNKAYIDISHLMYDQVRDAFIQYSSQKAMSDEYIIRLGATFWGGNRKRKLQNITPTIIKGIVYAVSNGRYDKTVVEDKYMSFYQNTEKDKPTKDGGKNISKAPEFQSVLKKFTDAKMPLEKGALNIFLENLFGEREYLSHREYINNRYIHTVITPFSSYQELEERRKAFLVMSFDETAALEELGALKAKMFTFLFSALLLLVLTLYFLYARVVKPLSQLKGKMEDRESFEIGNLASQNDEIARMIQIYNNLLLSLKNAAAKNREILDNFKTFTGNSIHQVRTPIAVIKISQEMIGEEYKDAKEQIKSSVTLMEHIYDNLAYQAQKELVEFSKEPLDISAILEERIKIFSVVASANDKEIISNIEEGIWFDINKIQIEYLMDNNISNAIKYGAHHAPIFVTLEFKDKKIVMSFANEGKPIKNKAKIFNRFERESNGKQGHGIGLHIVKEICEKYNIKVSLRYENAKNIFEYTLNK